MKAKVTGFLLAAVAAALFAAPTCAQYDYNRALQLDGSGDYIDVSSPPAVTTEMTVEAWVKTSVATGDQAVVSRYKAFSGSNLDDSFLLSVHNGRARFQINPGNMFVILDGTRLVADGRWHHLTGSYNGGGGVPRMYLLVDGFNDGELAVGGALNNPAGTNLRVGALYGNTPSGADFFFNGMIDEVRLWDRVYFNLPAISCRKYIPIRNHSGAYPLRAAWRFNGYPDTGFNAAFVGQAVEIAASDVPLNQNTYISLDGDEEYLSIFNGNSLTPTTGLTVEARVRTWSRDGTLQSVVSKFRHNSNSLTDDAYFLGIEPTGVARFQVSIGSNYHLLRGTTNLIEADWLNGSWHHLAGVFDGSELRLYVDGQLEASGPLFGSISVNSTPLYIGASQEGAAGAISDFFRGNLDEVRVWSVARTEAEIRGGLTTTAGLTARWAFEGDFINLVNYRSGNPRYWGTPVGTRENIVFVSGCDEAISRV
ncbi:MAG TPA: LamG domain-containing protein [Blastocatellia bacterium]|nr:LamG domain-containing protein [Blastocatellia bacterium]